MHLMFWCILFSIFHKVFLNFLFEFFFDLLFFKNMLFNSHIFVNFPIFLPLSISRFRIFRWEKILDMISFFFNVLSILWPICDLSWGMFHACLRIIYFATLGQNTLFMSLGSLWSEVMLNSDIYLLISRLDDISLFESRVLKSSIVIVLLSFFLLFC